MQLARAQDQEFRLGSLLSDGVVLQREQGGVSGTAANDPSIFTTHNHREGSY